MHLHTYCLAPHKWADKAFTLLIFLLSSLFHILSQIVYKLEKLHMCSLGHFTTYMIEVVYISTQSPTVPVLFIVFCTSTHKISYLTTYTSESSVWTLIVSRSGRAAPRI